MAPVIFLVEDEAHPEYTLQPVLEQKAGYRLIHATSGREAIERFMLKMKPYPDAMVMCLGLADGQGIEVIRTIRRTDRYTPVLAIAPSVDNRLISGAIEAGVDDLLVRPVTPEQVRLSLHNMLVRNSLAEEVARLSRMRKWQVSFGDMIGASEPFLAMVKSAKRAADSAVAVHLEGEKGSGKELLARAIHGSSLRAGKPLEVIDAAMLGEDDGELRRFAQTCLQAADGTVVVKAIENLPTRQQRVLLHALQTQMMRQTDDASKGPQSKDGLFQARLISISDESLKNAVYQGRFHEELYVRLTGFPIRVPSLRERQQDIPELSRFFVQRFSVREHLSIQNFSDDAKELLTRHTWPDNVIELRHVVFRALMRSEGTRIEAEQVAEAMVEYDPGMPSHIIWSGKWGEMFERMRERSNHFSLILRDGNVRSLAELEEEMIRFAIRHYNGRMTEVAKRLGIGRSTLYRKLQDYNIQDVDAA